MSDHQQNPLVSFCIATYKRENFLRKTIESIISQSYSNWEIVVSDNDDQQSARSVIKSYHSTKIKYYSNSSSQKNMVTNFNNALRHASGEFVCMVADDDPIRPDMLQELISLYQKNPQYGMYFGACTVVVQDENIARASRNMNGSNNLLNPKQKYLEVREYSQHEFINAFIHKDVFPYMLWSTGFIRKNLVIHNGGMPEYGTPLFTDYAYLLCNSAKGCVTINKVLGQQTLHGNNSCMRIDDFNDLDIHIRNLLKYLFVRINKEKLGKRLEIRLLKFFNLLLIDHLMIIYKNQAERNSKVTKKILQIYADVSRVLSFDSFMQNLIFRLVIICPIPFEYLYYLMNGTIYRYLQRKLIYKLYLNKYDS